MTDLRFLKKRYLDFKEHFPHTMIRTAAKELGVSEMQLLELELGFGAIRLKGDFEQLLLSVIEIGDIVALTRNDTVILEKLGCYQSIVSQKSAKEIKIDGGEINLNLCKEQLKYAYAVKRRLCGAMSYALHFFNKNGEATHKIFTLTHSNLQAYYEIITNYKADIQKGITPLYLKKEQLVQYKFKDLKNYREQWFQYDDHYNLAHLCDEYQLQKSQALKFVPRGYSYQIAPKHLEDILSHSLHQQILLMIDVHNDGCTQRFIGILKNIAHQNGWLKFSDSTYSLHINLSDIKELWIVRKPTKDGIVSALELNNHEGEAIMTILGEKVLGYSESELWKNLIDWY